MWDMATPIIVNGIKIANLFLGQFFFEDEEPDYQLFTEQAKKYGFDTNAYITALDKVPRWSRDTVNNVMDFYTKLAVMISKLSINNVQFKKSMEKLQQAEEELLKSHQYLEQKVEERTCELQASHTQLKTAYRDLKQAHARILHQEKMVSIGQLASGIAHEINTPCQYVNNNIRFVQASLDDIHKGMEACLETTSQLKNGEINITSLDKLDTTLKEIEYDYLRDEVTQALEESVQGIERISNIVLSMKDFARPSRDIPEPVDITRLIEQAIEISSNTWKAVADLTFEPYSEPMDVNGFSDELSQVVLHLILNAADAIEATHQDSNQPGHIHIQTFISETLAEIVVTDTGCGMKPEVQQRIFEPFFTTKEVGRGSGQGLAIAHHIITDKHHGELLVNSVQNQGSRFTIRLPRAILN
jgi:signal transduction histidine kinase